MQRFSGEVGHTIRFGRIHSIFRRGLLRIAAGERRAWLRGGGGLSEDDAERLVGVARVREGESAAAAERPPVLVYTS
jgi:hypothetical protein